MSASLSPTIRVADTDVQIVEYKDERVVTFKQIDDVHGRPDGTAKRTFDANRERFVEGEDFLEVGQDEIRTDLAGVFSKFAPRGYVFKRRGYLKLCKSLHDDRAWAVFDEMLDRYFAAERAVAPRQMTTAETLLQMLQLQVDSERRQLEQETALREIGSKVERIEQAQTVMSSCPANAESITHLRKRIRKTFGVSDDTVDAVMRQSPYAPKPAGTVRNGHEDAEGSTYLVYWKKDVTAVFERFRAECRQATPTKWTHPFVAGRFSIRQKEIA